MNIDIRKSIMNNFKGSTKKDIIESIENAILDHDEVTLPGLGVFFEIMWQNSIENEKDKIVQKILSSL